MLSFTFPGQGSQRPGMGRPWVDHESWELVEEASDVAGRDVARLLLDADADELKDTRNAQLTTFVSSLMVLDAVERLGIEPSYCAGHSLGEYTALAATGALSFADGVRLVCERADAMHEAGNSNVGTMAAVLGLDDDQVETLEEIGVRYGVSRERIRQLEAKALTRLRDLCAGDVRNDVFSQRLNYYAGATLRLRNVTSLRDPHVQPEFTLFSERRTVVGAYEQTTDIGAVASATHDVGDRLEATVRYAYTNSRTLADRAVSCTRFGNRGVGDGAFADQLQNMKACSRLHQGCGFTNSQVGDCIHKQTWITVRRTRAHQSIVLFFRAL